MIDLLAPLKFIGKMFMTSAEKVVTQTLSDEFAKVQPEIEALFGPILDKVPPEHRAEALQGALAAAEKIGTATLEAYINAQCPALAAIPAPAAPAPAPEAPAPTTPAPGAPAPTPGQ